MGCAAAKELGSRRIVFLSGAAYSREALRCCGVEGPLPYPLRRRTREFPTNSQNFAPYFVPTHALYIAVISSCDFPS